MLRPALALLAGLLLVAGCAPTSLGTIDLRTPPPELQGRRLLVVIAPVPAEGASRALPDTVRATEFVPLGQIGASSYRGVAADTLVAALRASGTWTDVRVGPMPAGVDLVHGSFRVARPVPGQRDPEYRRYTLAAPSAPAGAFGPDVDAVLVIADAGTGFGKARQSIGMAFPVPGTPVAIGVGTPGQDDDVIATRAALVLWDDATGAIVAHGTPVGSAPIRSRLFSSAESRSPRGLIRESRQAFVEAVAEDMPLLGLGD
ncbi:MAG TPA: hypothetical protein VF576_00220 [Rubricoccaceae bacterium]